MVKLELNHYGVWCVLYPDQDVLDEIEETEKNTFTTSGLIEVADFPKLQSWMKLKGYKQAYVMRSFKPDVRVVKKVLDNNTAVVV